MCISKIKYAKERLSGRTSNLHLYANALRISRPMAAASGGGTALPICVPKIPTKLCGCCTKKLDSFTERQGITYLQNNLAFKNSHHKDELAKSRT